MKKAVIFDIDGTLAEMSPERTGREYDKVHLDKPIKQTFEILDFYLKSIKHCSSDLDIVLFVTGRKELCRKQTAKFIENNSSEAYWNYGIYKGLSEEFYEDDDGWYEGDDTYPVKLFMRGNKDHRKDYILKKEIYDTCIKDIYEVVAVFEDRPSVCRMWRDLGLLVYQVGAKDDF